MEREGRKTTYFPCNSGLGWPHYQRGWVGGVLSQCRFPLQRVICMLFRAFHLCAFSQNKSFAKRTNLGVTYSHFLQEDIKINTIVRL